MEAQFSTARFNNNRKLWKERSGLKGLVPTGILICESSLVNLTAPRTCVQDQLLTQKGYDRKQKEHKFENDEILKMRWLSRKRDRKSNGACAWWVNNTHIQKHRISDIFRNHQYSTPNVLYHISLDFIFRSEIRRTFEPVLFSILPLVLSCQT